jgi:hypothetical protein
MDIYTELQKATVVYEQLFERKAPGCDCSDEELLIFLDGAVRIKLPLEEETKAEKDAEKALREKWNGIRRPLKKNEDSLKIEIKKLKNSYEKLFNRKLTEKEEALILHEMYFDYQLPIGFFRAPAISEMIINSVKLAVLVGNPAPETEMGVHFNRNVRKTYYLNKNVKPFPSWFLECPIEKMAECMEALDELNESMAERFSSTYLSPTRHFSTEEVLDSVKTIKEYVVWRSPFPLLPEEEDSVRIELNKFVANYNKKYGKKMSELEKAKARYKMQFGKEVAPCEFSDEVFLEQLMESFVWNDPWYLSRLPCRRQEIDQERRELYKVMAEYSKKYDKWMTTLEEDKARYKIKFGKEVAPCEFSDKVFSKQLNLSIYRNKPEPLSSLPCQLQD